MIDLNTYVAATRFGLGLRPGEAAALEGNPKQWLIQQINSPRVTTPALSALPSTQQAMQHMLELYKERKEAKEAGDPKVKIGKEFKAAFIDDMRARLQQAITTPTPFYERLVDFWSNHFCVSIKKERVASIAGAYEREAIRPNVTGKFIDMLLASAHHPAMLMYLDNAQSIGPNSIAGQRRGKGLNENLAREIMELHTLGVDAGYTQEDVTNFAKVLTGWTIAPLNDPTPGVFQFLPRRHEPGAQMVFGNTYDDNGEDQGIAVLHAFAAHPATAHHIATKLVRHFVADTPPDAVIERIATVFSNSGGDLPQVYAELINAPEAWDVRANPKIKSSYDLIVSAARATAPSQDDDLDYALRSLNFLGDIPFTADSPAGLPDTANDIAGPDAMIRRVQWAQMTSKKMETALSPSEFMGLTIGPIASDSTRSVIQDAKGQEGIAIAMGSPEFQRR
jgi:uncharacterized protein (DUF1800 family)